MEKKTRILLYFNCHNSVISGTTNAYVQIMYFVILQY